jgi:hypothetical protein
MQSRVKRAVLDLNDISRRALDVFCDLVAMGGTKKQDPQNQHVERTLEQRDPIG